MFPSHMHRHMSDSMNHSDKTQKEPVSDPFSHNDPSDSKHITSLSAPQSASQGRSGESPRSEPCAPFWRIARCGREGGRRPGAPPARSGVSRGSERRCRASHAVAVLHLGLQLLPPPAEKRMDGPQKAAPAESGFFLEMGEGDLI